MVIFYSYVSLPEGIFEKLQRLEVVEFVDVSAS